MSGPILPPLPPALRRDRDLAAFLIELSRRLSRKAAASPDADPGGTLATTIASLNDLKSRLRSAGLLDN